MNWLTPVYGSFTMHLIDRRRVIGYNPRFVNLLTEVYDAVYFNRYGAGDDRHSVAVWLGMIAMEILVFLLGLGVVCALMRYFWRQLLVIGAVVGLAVAVFVHLAVTPCTPTPVAQKTAQHCERGEIDPESGLEKIAVASIRRMDQTTLRRRSIL
jgi:hypothetical protein